MKLPLKKEKTEFVEILGFKKEFPIAIGKNKALYIVSELDKYGEAKVYFYLKVNGYLKGIYFDPEEAHVQYNLR
jgi:hypothetical protein